MATELAPDTPSYGPIRARLRGGLLRSLVDRVDAREEIEPPSMGDSLSSCTWAACGALHWWSQRDDAGRLPPRASEELWESAISAVNDAVAVSSLPAEETLARIGEVLGRWILGEPPA